METAFEITGVCLSSMLFQHAIVLFNTGVCIISWSDTKLACTNILNKRIYVDVFSSILHSFYHYLYAESRHYNDDDQIEQVGKLQCNNEVFLTAAYQKDEGVTMNVVGNNMLFWVKTVQEGSQLLSTRIWLTIGVNIKITCNEESASDV